MRYQNRILSGALLLCLILVIIAALAAGGEKADDGAPIQDTSGQSIQILELCAKNETILADNRGNYPDYIELYNPGPPVNLKGYTLTNGEAVSPPLGDLPMDTDSYRVIYLGEEYTGFGIRASGGDTIRLIDPQGVTISQVTVPASAEDQVLLWQEGSFALSMDASPGFSNDAPGVAAFRQGKYTQDMPLRISEILTANRSSAPDENGRYRDAVELCNASSEAVRLDGWYLSDSVSARYRFRLPEITLSPGSYLVLYCDGENYIGPGGEIHTNFALSRGEAVCLTDSRGNYCYVATQYLGDDVSLALQPEGSYAAAEVSLGYPNDAAGVQAFAATRLYSDSPLIISEVLLSSADIPYQGAFRDAVEIYNRSNAPVNTAGWYLTDDSDPYRFPLPERVLAAGECMVVLCGKEETGFALSAGDVLSLTAPNFLYAPQVVCSDGSLGQSMSAQLSGGELSYAFGEPTVGYENRPENADAFWKALQPQGLRISEVMSSSSEHLQGPNGTACDWIELYNGSDVYLELSDYALTTNANNLQKYPLPRQTLAPGESVCILLSEAENDLPSGYHRLPFSLSASGEAVYLSKDGTVADFVFLPELRSNTAYGRAPGGYRYGVMESPTPGKPNSRIADISAPVTALTQPGSYNNAAYLDIALSAPGEIYYTTNCTTPSRSSQKYAGPIRITKTTVLRVICYEDGKQASRIVDLTYLLNENDGLSVVSIVTPPGNLWSEEYGIYASGPGWTPEFPHHGANYWMDWEYPATISLLDGQEEGFFSVPCGLKIFGGYSRANSKKSLACMFRGEYGAAYLDYPVFGDAGLDRYKAIVLRAGGQDAFMTRIRDEVITSYVNQELGLPVQKYRPVVVYLNGQYYGLHFIREKVNENYVAGNYQVAKEDVDLTYWDGPTSPAYRALLDYARQHDLSQQAHFDYVASQIDLQNYTDYMITQMWIGNIDTANNKFFSTPEHPWTWVLYDTDLGMRDHTYDCVADLLDVRQLQNIDVNSTVLLLRLLENESYKDYFLRRAAWQCSQVWVADQFIAHIDAVQEQVAVVMEKDCQRWQCSYKDWLYYVETMRSFAQNRGPYFRKALQRHFGLTDQQMIEYGFILEN